MTKTMHALTLRIDEALDEMLVDASFEQGISKSRFIRETLHSRLGNETAARKNHVRADSRNFSEHKEQKQWI